MRIIKTIKAGLLVLLVAAPAFAQTPPPTVYNPTKIMFDSPSHTTACPGPTCVSDYLVEFWMSGAVNATSCQPVQTGGAPVSSSTIAKAKVVTNTTPPGAYQALFADFVPLFAIPVGNTYVACLVARGPGGSSPRSDPSDPFASASAPLPVAQVSVR